MLTRPQIFFIPLIFFVLFSIVYGLFGAAIIYHLERYVPPGRSPHRIFIAIFLLTAITLWMLALLYLVQIPR